MDREGTAGNKDKILLHVTGHNRLTNAVKGMAFVGEQFAPVAMNKRFERVLAKFIANNKWTSASTAPMIWIRPEKIIHRALIWNLLDRIQSSNVTQCIDRTGRTTTQAKFVNCQ